MKPGEVYGAREFRYPEDRSQKWRDYLILKKYLGQDKWLAAWWVWTEGKGHAIYMDYPDQHDFHITGEEVMKKYVLIPNFKKDSPVDI